MADEDNYKPKELKDEKVTILVWYLVIAAVRAVLYWCFRFTECPGTFEIQLASKNEKDHVINKLIEQIIVISNF